MAFLLQHLLQDSARAYPSKTAVACGSESITYQALHEATDRLASALMQNGVCRGDRVGIYMNKSIASIVSIHGIMKAGATYVPLDPNSPLSRLAYIIQNCGIRCLLTSGRKARSLSNAFAGSNPLDLVVLMDDENTDLNGLSARILLWRDVPETGNVSLPANPSIETDLAYILYTSGSTGAPKGVMISHLNALTFVNWACEAIGVTSEDRLSNHAPLHFDLSIFDIFAAFKAGATAVLVPDGLSPFPARLAQWIDDNEISVWYSVPSMLSMIVLHGQIERFEYRRLRAVLFAGEVFPMKYLRQLMTLVPQADYYNLYGPTETNVITCYRVPGAPPEGAKPLPIGKACANTEVFALSDDRGVVAKPGELGELYARGSCVAQGYWGDASKTASSFIQNPLQPHFSGRVYRTGDLVTLDDQGNYVFLGRRDHMVKSRGYRIELGEIESALYGHPDVKEAAVVAVPDELVGSRIKAFVALNKRNGTTAASLQSFCLKRLPRYMVPEAIEFWEELPRTSTGKINRPALAESS